MCGLWPTASANTSFSANGSKLPGAIGVLPQVVLRSSFHAAKDKSLMVPFARQYLAGLFLD